MSKERDMETGYDYMEQRYYWKDGSFWSRPDPLMDKNIELSPYAYCNGNPLIRIDPDGRADYYEQNNRAISELVKAEYRSPFPIYRPGYEYEYYKVLVEIPKEFYIDSIRSGSILIKIIK